MRRHGEENELQWGHAMIGVETGNPTLTASASRALQWGHAMIGVETRRATSRGVGAPALQWGHAMIGVETCMSCGRHSCGRGFNGATP